MRKQIIIRSTFAKTLDQKFSKGQAVYYAANFSGAEYPGVIVGVGKENGDIVYDVKLTYPGAPTSTKWGYEDQFRPRTTDSKDGIGSAEEMAYGEGYHAQRSDPNPYASPELKAAFEKGRAKSKQTQKLNSAARKGEYPIGPGSKKTSFTQPRMRDAKDFNSEQGWIAKIFAPNGKVVTQSEPFITKGPAEAWLRLQLSKAQNAGLRATGGVFNGFFDPSSLSHV